MMVQRRGAHADAAGEPADFQRLMKILPQPARRARHLVARPLRQRHVEDAAAFRTGQQTIEDLLLDKRRQRGDILRLIQQANQADNRIHQQRRHFVRGDAALGARLHQRRS